MNFKKRKPRIAKGKGGSGIFLILMLGAIFGLSVALVSNKRFSPTTNHQFISPSYSCCDSGDGDACHPIAETRIFYQGIKSATEEEYHLLKSNVYLRSQDHHIDPDPNGAKTSAGERIFYNPRSELNNKDWLPECFSNKSSPGKQKYGYDDFIFGPGTGPNTNPDNPNYPELGCFAIPNEQLVYVCRADNEPGECDNKSGHARFDIYYRASDFAATGVAGIHPIIKNCVKPDVTLVGGDGSQQLINLPNPSGKANLQLETFGITSDPPVIDWISPYCKPAIYLYPEEKTTVQVQVMSQQKLTYTIPQYPPNGWRVIAHPNGMVTVDNTSYDYLYYETEVPDNQLPLPKEGYVISYGELAMFLPDVVRKLGLNKKETGQFSEYWLGVLPKTKYYRIKIIEQTHINDLVQLVITPQPTTVLRVTLHFEPLENDVAIEEPVINPVERTGFTVAEWGGIFKRTKDHPFSCFM